MDFVIFEGGGPAEFSSGPAEYIGSLPKRVFENCRKKNTKQNFSTQNFFKKPDFGFDNI